MASDGTGTVTPMRNSAAFQAQQALAANSKYFAGQQFQNKKQKTEDKTMAPPALPAKK